MTTTPRTPTGSPAPRPKGEVALRQAALAAEHAAVYAYGVLGARLSTAQRRQATAAFDAHRSRRDALASGLRAAGLPAPPAEPAYDVAVSTAADARALAVRLEEGVGVRWRDLVGGTSDPAVRAQAVSALTDTAVRAAQWRRLLGVRPPSVALPGVPTS
jgi:hypothetical protein